MKRYVFSVMLSTSCLVACSSLRGGDRLNADYAPRVPVAAIDRSLAGPIDDVARVLAFPRLNAVTLPSAAREVRISSWYSMAINDPVGVVRLSQHPGRPAIGEVLFLWGETRDASPPFAAATCTSWKDDHRQCAHRSRVRIDWPRVATRLRELGVWSIRTPCETDGRSFMDAGELAIQRLDAAQLDGYQCNAPRFRTGTEAGRAAAALFEYYEQVVREADERRRPNER